MFQMSSTCAVDNMAGCLAQHSTVTVATKKQESKKAVGMGGRPI